MQSQNLDLNTQVPFHWLGLFFISRLCLIRNSLNSLTLDIPKAYEAAENAAGLFKAVLWFMFW